ncbi:hypothetical protein BGW80DRAFT_231870 [Lactifluus volemus]|nr:hypothetical protein BGW80DRAFT_231870 [Lactifluus volemus]
MANSRDPNELLRDTLTLVKLWHACYGIFLLGIFYYSGLRVEHHPTSSPRLDNMDLLACTDSYPRKHNPRPHRVFYLETNRLPRMCVSPLHLCKSVTIMTITRVLILLNLWATSQMNFGFLRKG